jgi:hypothetical protein
MPALNEALALASHSAPVKDDRRHEPSPSAAGTTQPVPVAQPTLAGESMTNHSRDILLYGRLVDLHRRKTEAELMGFGTHAYDALIQFYELELAEIEEARSKQSDGTKPEAA